MKCIDCEYYKVLGREGMCLKKSEDENKMTLKGRRAEACKEAWIRAKARRR